MSGGAPALHFNSDLVFGDFLVRQPQGSKVAVRATDESNADGPAPIRSVKDLEREMIHTRVTNVYRALRMIGAASAVYKHHILGTLTGTLVRCSTTLLTAPQYQHPLVKIVVCREVSAS